MEIVNDMEYDDPVQVHIDGTLDLHTFQPREIKRLIPDYLTACLEQNIVNIRIVHGKGTGTLRRIVHSVLEKLPYVVSFKLADETAGSWGATLVILKPPK